MSKFIYKLMLFFIFLNSYLYSKTRTINDKNEFNKNDIEIKIWASKKHELFKLEKMCIVLIQENPSSSFVHYLLALINLKKAHQDISKVGGIKKALELSLQSIELEPNKEYGYSIAAYTIYKMGLFEDAVNFIRGSPGGWRTSLVSLLINNKLSLETKIQFLKGLIIKQEQGNRVLILQYIKLLNKNKSPSFIIKQIKSLKEKNIEHPKLLLELAVQYSEIEQYDQSLLYFKEIIGSQNHDREERLKYSEFLLKTNKHKEALESYLELLKSSSSEDEIEKIISGLCIAYFELEHLEKAEETLARLLDLTRRNNYSNILVSTLKKFNPKTLFNNIDIITKTIRYKAYTNTQMLNQVSKLFSKKDFTIKHALTLIQHAIKLDPKNPTLITTMGMIYYSLSKYNFALISFNKALNLNPLDATAFYHRARIYSLQNKELFAIENLKKALFIDPNLVSKAKNDINFNNIKYNKEFINIIMKIKDRTSPFDRAKY